MNSQRFRGFTFALLAAVVLLATACGTLEIDTEPTAAPMDAEVTNPAVTPVAVTTEVVQLPTPQMDETLETGDEVASASASATTTTAEAQSYINDAYGFTLSHPPGWSLSEVNDVDFVGPGSRSVQLSQGTVTLVIGYRRAGEAVAISGSGAPGGEFEIRGTTQLLGRDVERYVIVYEGKDKVVMYGEPGSGPIALGGLEFSARLDDFNPDYGSVELSQVIQDEADMILSSLATIEATVASDSDIGDEYSVWKPYSNEQLGYSLMIPGAAEVMSLDPNERVVFSGPEVDGKPEFQFMVVHYDIDATEADKFMQDIPEGHRAFLESIGRTAEGQIEEMVIDGESAIRTSFPAVNGTEPRDDYFFVHDGKMYTISITHFDGVEDQSLNDLFLRSITLD